MGTIDSGGPCYGTGEAAEPPQEMVVDLECWDTVRRTLEGERMCMVDPRLVSELSCELVRSVAGKLVCGQSRLSDQWAEKHSFMFDEGASTSNLCSPGMCKLDCPWLIPYLFVSLGGWPFGIRVQPNLSVIRAYCRESPTWGTPPGPVRHHYPAPLWEIVDCFPDNIGPVTCPDLVLDFDPGFTCRPSDLITLFGVLSAYGGFSVSFVQPLSRLSSSGQGELIKESFFRLMCHCLVIPVCCLFSPYCSRSCQIRGY